jgi:cell division protein FtsB
VNSIFTLGFGVKILACVAIVGGYLYLHIEKQNDLIALRLAIPALTRENKGIQEENIRLRYLIDQFENPSHLMEVARQPEFAHLKHIYTQDLILFQNANPLGSPQKNREKALPP